MCEMNFCKECLSLHFNRREYKSVFVQPFPPKNGTFPIQMFFFSKVVKIVKKIKIKNEKKKVVKIVNMSALGHISKWLPHFTLTTTFV